MIKYDPYAQIAWQERARLKRESLLTSLGDEMKVGSLKEAAANRRRDYGQQLRDQSPTGQFRTVAKEKKKVAYRPPTLKKTVKMSGLMSRWSSLGHMKRF